MPDVVELRGIFDLLALRLALGHQGDRAVRGNGGIEGGDALLAPHLERHDHLGEDDRLAQGDERKLPDARHVDSLLVFVDVLLVVLLGRPVSHLNLLIESWPREWPLYV